jgi:hypothetical protein
MKKLNFLIRDKMIKNYFSTSTKGLANAGKNLLNIEQVPGPKYYPMLGPLNEIITLGKNER